MPVIPNSLTDLAAQFENGELQRFSCCNAPFFKVCVQDIDGRKSLFLPVGTHLIQNVVRDGISEKHAHADTFKVVPRNMGYQLLTIHCMIQNYVRRYLWPKSFTKKFVKHSIQYESAARNVYIKNTNQTVLECGVVTNLSNPWLGYTPDGVIVDDENFPVKIIEIKCPYKGKTSTISDLINNLNYIIKNQDGSYSLKPNHSYYAQIQLGIVLLNVTVCDFIIYSSNDNNYLLIQVSFDDMYCKTMLNNLKCFYFERLLINIKFRMVVYW